MTDVSRVVLFGAFDPLHEGHRNLFEQARALGHRLTVVVARDTAIRAQKGRVAFLPEHKRIAAVAHELSVDDTLLGDIDPTSYATLANIPFDVLVLGYDQHPSNNAVKSILEQLGLGHVHIVRLAPYKSYKYKSSFFRT